MNNQLFYGDNLNVLRNKIPSESVDLCYIDPPFNSKRNYFQIYNNIGTDGSDKAQAQAFMDTWQWGDEAIAGLLYITDINNLNNSKFTPQTVALMKGLEQVLGCGDLLAYLVHMTLRVVEIHRVLKPTGSFYLHCDPTASHYLKLVLDSVFCADGNGGEFLNEIIWKRIQGAGKGSQYTKRKFGANTDTILFYTKSSDYQFNPYRQLADAELNEKFNKIDAKGHKYYDDSAHIYRSMGLGVRPNLCYEWRGFKNKTPAGWVLSQERLEEEYQKGNFIIRENGKLERRKYLKDFEGVNISNFWEDIPPAQGKEKLGYPTQKPEELLERIIKASSKKGDVVLDAYCGCGTTVAVAQRLKRQWIGIDITYQSISLILFRLKKQYPKQWVKLEASIKLDGIPKDKASAIALANRKDDKTRKEFEKWAVLTYSDNQARINDKKGADGGIDGIAYFMIDANTNGKAIFQVKSGGASRATIATLNSDRQREKAEFGILITMDKPTKPMLLEVHAAGKYKHPLLNREDDRIQIITVQELLDGLRLNLPMSRDMVKSAQAVGDADSQEELI